MRYLAIAVMMILTQVNAETTIRLPTSVKVARSPGGTWSTRETRTLDALPVIPADPASSRFGGSFVRAELPTGFFRTMKTNGRWWLVDPDGHLFIHRGVTSVRQIKSSGAEDSLRRRFRTTEGWADFTGRQLHEYGFNGLGAWSDDPVLRPSASRLVYTKLWSFMSSYGKIRGGVKQLSGHVGYPGNCPFIFDPQFPAFCDQHARQLAATKDDPWLLGHFTDNELPWSRDMLANYLKLPDTDPGHAAALRWLRQRHGQRSTSADITPRDRDEFVAHAADTYFAAVSSAIRRHDPNHLVLGSRFHGGCLRIPQLFEAAGRHLDVISVNYYNAWTPDSGMLSSWEKRSAKPILITEWYAKAMDSGLANTSGAGWLVKTQADRAAFYQNFTLGLLESRVCVGWHWFRYSDNDPDEKGADPSNADSNKGIVSNRYQPYQTLLDAMKEVNIRTFGIIRCFDRPDQTESEHNNPPD
jgi:hypothetical protein